MLAGPSTNIDMSSSANEAGSSQNEMLFMRGKAMSGAPIISGTNQLPKPPIIAGITMKNTMMRPWPVTNALKHVAVGEDTAGPALAAPCASPPTGTRR